MIKLVSFENVNNRYNLKSTKKDANANSFQGNSLSLSNSQLGQAILNRNNIAFRNLSVPIEVTDKYNKPIQGKDHLDLPNIHVYEYPDTNLQAIINVDNTIRTNNENFMEQPQIIVKVSNCSSDEKNLLAEDLIKTMMSTKLQEKSEYLLVDEVFDKNTFISFSEWGGENVINNLHNLNNVTLNLQFNDRDLNLAKTLLYGKYDNDKMNNISRDFLQSYYQNLKNNFSAQAFVTVSKDYYDNNKNQILTELNKDINLKLQKNSSKNKDILKNEILNDMSIAILNSYKDFNNEFLVRKYDKNQILLLSKNDFDEKKYFQILEKILNENMQSILNLSKKNYIQDTQKVLTQDNLPIIKNVVLAKLGNNLNNIYAVLESIQEEEIKDYIKANFVENLPIVAKMEQEDHK